jgi:hypothetical protein
VSGNENELPGSFSEQDIKRIADSLPEPACERRRELLPKILHEWVRTDLRRNLSLPTKQDILKRSQRIKLVVKCAQELLQALSVTTNDDRNQIAYRMVSKGRNLDQIDQSGLNEFRNLKARLEEELKEEIGFLTRLAAITSTQVKKPPGRPRNFAGYLVLMDAASIFLWYTGMDPVRGVDRITNAESGPFFRFASVLWPMVFEGDTDGLRNSIRNWAVWRPKDELRPANSPQMANASPLVANIALRHPEWGVT